MPLRGYQLFPSFSRKQAVKKGKAEIAVKFLRDLDEARKRCTTPKLLAMFDGIGTKRVVNGKESRVYSGGDHARLTALELAILAHEEYRP